MKKVSILAALAVSLPLWSQAQVTTAYQQPTAVQIANGFTKTPVSYWQGAYSFMGVTNGVTTSVQSSFTVQQIGTRWGFTQMSINGTELPIDAQHPLWQIPPYLAGSVTNFTLWVYGYDNSGQVLRDGYFNVAQLGPNDDINVIIYLNYVQRLEKFPLTGDHTANNTTIMSADGQYSGWYDSTAGGFRVSYDPLNPPQGWLVIDTRDNSVIGSIVPPGPSNTSSANTGYGFILQNDNETPELALNPSASAYYGYFRGLPMDKQITVNGTNYSGKAMSLHVGGASDYLQLFVSNLRNGSVVQIYGLAADGDTMVHVGDWVQSGNTYQLNIPNVTGYAGYTIVAYGGTSDPISGFTVSFEDLTGPASTGTTIGKGAVPEP